MTAIIKATFVRSSPLRAIKQKLFQAMDVIAKNLRRFKLITFDCTNTLLHMKLPVEEQYLLTAQKLGIAEENFDKNLVKQNFRKQFKELSSKHPNFGRASIQYTKWWETLVSNALLNSAAQPIDASAIKPVAEALVQQYQTKECWAHFEKSNELIDKLKKLNKTVGVISNFDPRLHTLLADLGLRFDFIATSYELNAEKPSSEIFQKALETAKLHVTGDKRIEPSECLHLGNELVKDFEGARNAGWSSILINSKDKADPSFASVEDFFEAITTKEIKI